VKLPRALFSDVGETLREINSVQITGQSEKQPGATFEAKLIIFVCEQFGPVGYSA